ncbi:MAG: cation:proton antiporter [Candidatus Aenigmatarchaeota archaeon]
MELLLFLAAIFLFTFVVGHLLERFRLPWIFAALLLGVILAVRNPFLEATGSETFSFLAHLGMYFLLFMVGFEIDLAKIRAQSRFYFSATFFIILLEGAFGSVLIRYFFGTEWLISVLVALSFATVGEAILVPILKEFRADRSSVGYSIINIGFLDNIIEVLLLVAVCFMVGVQSGSTFAGLGFQVSALVVLFVMAYGLTLLGVEGRKFKVHGIETVFLFAMFIFFLFLGVGSFALAMPIAAVLAGVALKNFLPSSRLGYIESEIRTMAFGFFAPIFFVWIGLSADIPYLMTVPWLVLVVFLVASGSKLLGSLIACRPRFGTKKALLIGLGLSVRMSTSLVVLKILLDSGLIEAHLYSVLIASTIVFKFAIPLLFSRLLLRWGVGKPDTLT